MIYDCREQEEKVRDGEERRENLQHVASKKELPDVFGQTVLWPSPGAGAWGRYVITVHHFLIISALLLVEKQQQQVLL